MNPTLNGVVVCTSTGRPARTPRSAAGFTLIEVMVAGALFLIALAGVLSSFGTARTLFHHFEESTVAVQIADGALEDMLLLPRGSNSLIAGAHGPIQYNAEGVPDVSGDFTLRWVVSGDTPVEGLRQVEVTVQWFESGKSHEVSLTTVRQ